MRAARRDPTRSRWVDTLASHLPALCCVLAVVITLPALGMVSAGLGLTRSRTLVSAPIVSAGCGRTAPVSPGVSADASVASGGQIRAFRLHVPTGYSSRTSVALVLDFHGDGSSAAQFERYTGLSEVADQQRFLVAYPQGLPAQNGQTGWAGVGTGQPRADDVLFTSDLLNALQRSYCIDPHRIYVMGFSRGGGMAGLLACRLAGRVAAFAPVSGAFLSSVESGCTPRRPVPMLEFHGSADRVVPYQGGGGENFLPIPRWLSGWAARDNCSGQSSIFYARDGATGVEWTGCAGQALVEHYELDGVGHAWPGGDGGPQTLNAGAAAWTFFQAHPLR